MKPTPEILIVDDSFENTEVLSAVLLRQGYQTRIVHRGSSALKVAETYPPDLILLDVLMPDADGFEVCQIFKKHEHLCYVPVIFITALEGTVNLVRAFEVGAADYITKPFNFEEVLVRVETHLTLYQQKKEIQRQNELKSNFLSMASHEFRTPISVIKASIDILRLHYERLAADKRIARFATIDLQLHLLDKLVDDILFFNKLDSGKFEFHPQFINVSVLCNHLAAQFQELNPHHQLLYDVAFDLPNAYVDVSLLEHILSNLLSNAFKYSLAGSQVIFRVFREQQWVVFQVEDQGIGIPKDEQAYLFDPFYRASNAKSILGTGLGLSIVQQFIEIHGGKISFTSEMGVGTQFIVDIPLQPAEPS